MSAAAALGLARRLWWALPIAALLAALLVTRATLSGVKADLGAARAAHEHTVAGYRAAAAERKAADLSNLARVAGEQTRISKEITDDYHTRLAALRADFAERVRRATGADRADPGGAGAADLPGLSDAPGRADDATRQARLPAHDALIASEQAEQLVALQAWVRGVAGVDVNGEGE